MEYIDFLHDVVKEPVRMTGGFYVTPRAPGWGLEFHEEFLTDHTYQNGGVWSHRPKNRSGVHFEWDPEA